MALLCAVAAADALQGGRVRVAALPVLRTAPPDILAVLGVLAAAVEGVLGLLLFAFNAAKFGQAGGHGGQDEDGDEDGSHVHSRSLTKLNLIQIQY